jgi:proteasome lid subunit RPN8/RPN11
VDALWLTEAQARMLVEQARADAPNETCGVLGGSGDRVQAVIPVPNAAEAPRVHYRLDERAQVKAFAQIEAAGQSVIGFYHSHPDGDPIPSPTDVQLASYPNTAYLIVGLKGSPPSLAAWVINYGEVARLPLHLGEDAPEPPKPLLSGAQKAAIMIAVALAFALTLWISLSLLPPAPAIPSTLR